MRLKKREDYKNYLSNSWGEFGFTEGQKNELGSPEAFNISEDWYEYSLYRIYVACSSLERKMDTICSKCHQVGYIPVRKFNGIQHKFNRYSTKIQRF